MGYHVVKLRVLALLQLALWSTYVVRWSARIHLSLAADSHLGSRAALLQPVLQTNFDESWRALNFGDLVISALIGLCCGFMGALYTQLHLLTIDVRRALAKRFPTGFAGFLADKCVTSCLTALSRLECRG